MRGRNLLLLLGLFASPVWADEAVTQQGRRFDGTLTAKQFTIASSAKPIPLDQIRFVRFKDHAAPVPRCRLLHLLELGGDQRLAGELQAVDAKEVRFLRADGRAQTLPRRAVVGISQPNGYLTRFVDDCEEATASWSGKPAFDAEQVFTGKKSLLVDATTGEIGLAIADIQEIAHLRRLTVFFYDPGTNAGGATARFHFDKKFELAIRLGDSGYGLDAVKQSSVKPALGWHILQLDWSQGEARIFIDDYLAGSQSLPKDVRLASVKFSYHGKGRMWFDAISLAEQAPPLKQARGPAESDELWLAGGDQLFGQIERADVNEITLAARFGKRAYAWSQVRAVSFATPSTAATGNLLVRFRSGPGVTADQLRGDLVDLDERRLLLRHPLLGDVAIERTRLERIDFVRP